MAGLSVTSFDGKFCRTVILSPWQILSLRILAGKWTGWCVHLNGDMGKTAWRKCSKNVGWCGKVIIAREARAFSWWAEVGQAPSLCLRAAKRKSSPVIASPPPQVRTEDRQIGSEGNILGRDEKEGSSRAQKWSFKDLNCNCECLPCV